MLLTYFRFVARFAVAFVFVIGVTSVAVSQERTPSYKTYDSKTLHNPQRQGGSGSFKNPGRSGPGGVLAQKQCCASGGGCNNVPSNTTSCGHFQTARTCDDDGQNCTNHGTPDFPED